jgi:hypothetical protein
LGTLEFTRFDLKSRRASNTVSPAISQCFQMKDFWDQFYESAERSPFETGPKHVPSCSSHLPRAVYQLPLLAPVNGPRTSPWYQQKPAASLTAHLSSGDRLALGLNPSCRGRGAGQSSGVTCPRPSAAPRPGPSPPQGRGRRITRAQAARAGPSQWAGGTRMTRAGGRAWGGRPGAHAAGTGSEPPGPQCAPASQGAVPPQRAPGPKHGGRQGEWGPGPGARGSSRLRPRPARSRP